MFWLVKVAAALLSAAVAVFHPAPVEGAGGDTGFLSESHAAEIAITYAPEPAG